MRFLIAGALHLTVEQFTDSNLKLKRSLVSSARIYDLKWSLFMSLFGIYEGNYLLVYWLAHYSSYCIPIVCKVCKINYIDPMIRIKCWVSFQEETKLRLTELIVYFIGGIVCQDDKLGVCVQQPSKCHIKCVKTDSRGCKPGTIKRDFTPIWFVSACGMSAKLLPLIELTPGEWENGINGHGALCLRTIIARVLDGKLDSFWSYWPCWCYWTVSCKCNHFR